MRGEPAFDIATQIEIGNETGWIIPTSGHRAYPYWHLSLDSMFWYDPQFEGLFGQRHVNMKGAVPDCPQDWPDHYPTRASPSFTGNLLTALGLAAPKTPTVTRR
ncbi:MAG: hypothetical protein KGL39_56280 [Patescibacteria group bacterium]|nr:hypothetical protein [Patescibacteria group bacterium]